MPQINKVIIIGAGPAGLAAALRLHDINSISVAVYEIREQPTNLGGAINIPANGLRLLDRLGVYGPLLKGGSITPQMAVHSVNGNELGRLDHISRINTKTGYEHMRIKRTVIIDALLSAVHARGIPIHFNKRLVTVNEDAVGTTVTFSDGSSDTADLVLGCDGIHSAVRKLHVDPEVTPEYSGISSMSSIVSLPTDLVGMHATFTSQGAVVVVPCADNENKELFWFLTRHIPAPDSAGKRDGWNEQREKEVAGFKTTVQDIIREIGGSWGSFLRDVVSKTDTVNFYPIYRLPQGGVWHTNRCILLGDAAHAMQPHVGQGVSMALEDVFLLSRLLKKESTPLAECLRVFETIRRPRIEKFASQAANNGERARQKGPWQVAISEWAMWGWLWARRVFLSWSWGVREEDWLYDIDEVDTDYFSTKK